MALVDYKPDDYQVSGYSLTLLVPAIANIKKPTMAELSEGYKVDGAMTSFKLGTDAETSERKMLSDKFSVETIGKRTYTTDNTTLLSDDPQTISPIESLVVADAIVYMVVRPGLDRETPLAAGQRVWVNKQQVVSRDAAEVNTDEGTYFSWEIVWATKERTYEGEIQA